MKFIPTIACATLSLLAFAEMTKTMSPDAPRLQRFEFPGLEARVFYNAESPLEKGSPATLAVVHVHGCGDADTEGPDKTALDVSPAAIAQGKNRYERFLNFKEYLKQFPEWEKQVSFHTFKGVSHQNAVAHSSPALIAFIVGQP